MRGFIIMHAVMLPLLLGCTGCWTAVTPTMRLEKATMQGDKLRVIVVASVIAVNPLRGERTQDDREYIVNYNISEETTSADFADLSEIPLPHGKSNGVGEVVVQSSGTRAVRIFDTDFDFVNDKAYASAKLDLLELDQHKPRWNVVRQLSKSNTPFLLSPSGRRIVLYEQKPKGLDLETMQEVAVPRLSEVFDAAGASWISEVRVPSLTWDEPPDYLALTDDFDYASADGGAVFSRTLFERAAGRKEAIPSSTRPTAAGFVADVVQVRRTLRGDWLFLCATRSLGFAILDHRFRIIAELRNVEQPASELKQFEWNPDEHVVVFFRKDALIHSLPATLQIWRYERGDHGTQIVNLDVIQHFRLSAHRYLPLTDTKTY